uniref:Multiple epidermal growth factor-like domains protein 6 n=1 Tax=Crassostrea virginica TaxID=6565 RepID=A0A8B8DU65_CRAVI|nr:multiple epidermal growth factor-like domains protein 6 [Crassostrea virginica]
MIMSTNIFKIIIFLALAHASNGGCDVNDWPRSCLANFRIGKQKCEPCESGRYGCNCSENCPNNTYGPGCYTFCDCPEDEFCDPMVGCMNTTTTTHTTRAETTQQGLNTPTNNISSSPRKKIGN